MSNLVDNAPLREACLKARAGGVMEGDICRDIGWLDAKGRPDKMRLRRSLGISEEFGEKASKQIGGPRTRRRIKYENAVKIARAIGADPVDVGI